MEKPVGSVGHIRIVDTLGAGGMGEVYVGWDETLERRVALKAIRRAHRMDPRAKARFLREARVLSQLDHPNICRIYDYVEGTDRDFLVLELVEGESLSAVIGRGMDDRRRLEIAEQIASALAAAHAKGVVHRDLKPHNVMLAADGAVKVLDFGLARSVDPDADDRDPAATTGAVEEVAASVAEAETLFEGDEAGDAGAMDQTGQPGDAATGPPADGTEILRPAGSLPNRDPALPVSATPPSTGGGSDGSWTMEGTLLGSPRYMSPEQARGEPATTASDLFAFGLLLLELFTGRPAYPPDLTVAELLRLARRGEHRPIEGVRSDVAALVGRLLELAPAARPTAVEVLGRLRWILDTPRRRLVRGAIAAVVLLAVLGGLKYTFDLKAARDVAERHRAQAEDLIGFMLGDLKTKLEGVGRLELLEDVGDKALAYYESLPTEDRTDDELYRRTQALRQIAEVRIAQGDLDAAMAALDEAEGLAEALVRRDPGQTEWLLGFAHGHFWKGNVHWLQGDLDAARGRFETYRELAERMSALEPDSSEWQLEQGYAQTNLAAVHEAMGRPGPALAALRRSLDLKKELLAAQPDNEEWMRSLANGLSWQGSMLIARGDLAGAADSFARERQIRRKLLASDPENADHRLLLATSSVHVGELALMRGDPETARAELGRARDLYRSLARHDPANLEWRRHQAVAEMKLADLALAEGDGGAASRALAAASVLLGSLVEEDPTEAEWRRDLANARLLAARVSLAGRASGRAVNEARTAVEAFRALLEESPGKLPLVAALALGHVVHGDALAAEGDLDPARTAWNRAAAVVAERAPVSRDPELRAIQAGALQRLGRDAEAAEIRDELEAIGYARTDFFEPAVF